MRHVLRIGIVLSVVTVAATAQQPPRFEVASINLWHPPTTPVTRVGGAPATGGSFDRAITVAGLIAYAYELQDFQLSGGEDWVRTERYDVSARAGREVSQTELREMVKTLLTDRFNLRVRTETREMPILELRRARNDGRVGPNLRECSDPNDKSSEASYRAPSGGTVATAPCANGMASLALIASRALETMVVDRTDLTGRWWFLLYYNGRIPSPIPGSFREQTNPDLPSFEGALGEQLGLRLERTRGPVRVVVIESVERPTPN